MSAEGGAVTKSVCVVRPYAAPSVECPARTLLRASARFAPRALPVKGKRPISFILSERISQEDGGHPPALREAILEFDRDVSTDARGLPVCERREIGTAGVVEARRNCEDAIVGRGSAQVEIEKPEWGHAPRTFDLPLTIFNAGTRSGTTTLLIHSSLAVESRRATLIAVAKLRPVHRGRYATQAILTLPRIDEGYGSIVHLQIGIRRRGPGPEGEGIATAVCPDGHLDLRMTDIFSDGTRLYVSELRRCARAS